MVLVTDWEKLQILGAIIKTAVKLKMTETPTDSFFFNPYELTKIVLQKFYQFLWRQIEPFGIANSIKKVFPFFPGNVH